MQAAEAFTHLAEVGSTNDWLLARADALPDGHWVRADRQTAGRGRRGRVWRDGAGNLMASVLVKADGPLQQLSFVAAVALKEAMAPVPVQLKWPNDLLLQGCKISGILLERTGDALVIGFGVNMASAPQDVERPSAAIGGDVATLFETLRQQFAHWRMIWTEQGFAPVRAAWLASACGLGQGIEVRLGSETLHGRLAGLDLDGALLLDLPSGTQRSIHAGEVFGLEAGDAAGD